jgi:hypothetical protein
MRFNTSCHMQQYNSYFRVCCGHRTQVTTPLSQPHPLSPQVLLLLHVLTSKIMTV